MEQLFTQETLDISLKRLGIPQQYTYDAPIYMITTTAPCSDQKIALMDRDHFLALSDDALRAFFTGLPLIISAVTSQWGSIQRCHFLAQGMYWVDGKGHEGIFVHEDTARLFLSAPARKIGHTFQAGSYLGYPGPHASQIVILEVPDFFSESFQARRQEMARDLVETFPAYYLRE